MAIAGYPDLLSYRQQLRTNVAIKTRLDTVAEEAITGRTADITKATNGRVGGAYLMQKAINDIEQEDRVNAVTKVRLDLMTQGLSGARTAINGIDTRALLALNSGRETEITAIATEAEANLRSAMTSLNAKHGSRSLFSGNATDTDPYSSPDDLLDAVRNIMTTAGTAAEIETALDTYFNDPAGGFQTDIYTGGTSAGPPVRIGTDEKITIDVRGDDQAIKEVLRGLAVIATAQDSGAAIGTSDFTDTFTSGINVTARGTSNLITLESNMGIYGGAIEQANARNQAETLSLSSALQTITGRDQFEAAAELQQLQVQLESSYLLTSRLSRLSLSNFLR